MASTPSVQRRKLPVISLIVLAVLVGALILIWTQRQAVYDWFRLYNYQPNAAISALATDATMTDEARHMYYVNRPELKPRSTFSQFCKSQSEQTVVLGCYKSVQQGIYILQVDNQELAGIQQVTAAHEMLHAAYDRLSSDEKQRVNALLQDYYDNKLDDDAIKQTIDQYKQSEPDALVNEMHSIFGTQVDDLPPALETYYSQYFSNRQTVVSFYKSYEQAFTSRQKQVKQYDMQLSTWKKQIDELQSGLTSQQSALETQRSSLNSQRSSGNYETYNNSVDRYNTAVVAFNRDLASLKQLIVEYNALVQKRNSIAFEEEQLMQSLHAENLQQQ